VMIGPENLKGVAVPLIEWKAAPNVEYVYYPALRKSRKLSGAGRLNRKTLRLICGLWRDVERLPKLHRRDQQRRGRGHSSRTGWNRLLSGAFLISGSRTWRGRNPAEIHDRSHASVVARPTLSLTDAPVGRGLPALRVPIAGATQHYSLERGGHGRY
jgi:hypothetical protein